MKTKIIKAMSNVFAFMAVVFATAPCNGRFHEPEMPKELQKEE